jgi:hypothetical protein
MQNAKQNNNKRSNKGASPQVLALKEVQALQAG